MSKKANGKPQGPHPDSVVGYYFDALKSASTTALTGAIAISPELDLQPKVLCGSFLLGASVYWGLRAHRGLAELNEARIANANGLTPAARFFHKTKAAAVNIIGAGVTGACGYLAYKNGIVDIIRDPNGGQLSSSEMLSVLTAGAGLNVATFTGAVASSYRAGLMN